MAGVGKQAVLAIDDPSHPIGRSDVQPAKRRWGVLPSFLLPTIEGQPLLVGNIDHDVCGENASLSNVLTDASEASPLEHSLVGINV
jgi:hypothetical protein